MTPDELRSLVDEGAIGSWSIYEEPHHRDDPKWTERWIMEDGALLSLDSEDLILSKARLIALAPDLARLCAEYAGAFAQIEKLHHKDFDLAPQIARRALAKLSELKT